MTLSKIPRPPLEAGPVPSPVLADYRRTFTAHRAAHTQHWRAAKGSAELMRAVLAERQDAARVEVGRLLALRLGLSTPLVPPRDGEFQCPDYLEPFRNPGRLRTMTTRNYRAFLAYNEILTGPRHPKSRLLDHEMLYRLRGQRGHASPTNSVVTAEPYIPDEQVPTALAEWAAFLETLGLTVRHLSKDLLLHAPDNPCSQLFLIGSPDRIGCLP